jgi:hypothetical protein
VWTAAVFVVSKPVNALSSVTFDRRAERTHMFVVATLYVGSSSAPVRVRNLSPTGALVEGAGLPPAGSAVVLRRGPLESAGVVAWSDGGRAGLSFGSPVFVSEWLPAKGNLRQAEVDRIAFGINQGTCPAEPAPAPAPAKAGAATASAPVALAPGAAMAGLEALRIELGLLGEQLARDASLGAGHPQVQLLDAAGQRIGKIIAALRPLL